MMEKSRDPTCTLSQQSVSGEAGEASPSEMDLSVAQRIGRQLAEIGDQLNWRHREGPPNAWLLPLHMAACAITFRRVVGCRQSEKTKPRARMVWLSSDLPSQVVRRLERWGIWVTHVGHPSSWVAGLLAAALLVTAAIWIGF